MSKDTKRTEKPNNKRPFDKKSDEKESFKQTLDNKFNSNINNERDSINYIQIIEEKDTEISNLKEKIEELETALKDYVETFNTFSKKKDEEKQQELHDLTELMENLFVKTQKIKNEQFLNESNKHLQDLSNATKQNTEFNNLIDKLLANSNDELKSKSVEELKNMVNELSIVNSKNKKQDKTSLLLNFYRKYVCTSKSVFLSTFIFSFLKMSSMQDYKNDPIRLVALGSVFSAFTAFGVTFMSNIFMPVDAKGMIHGIYAVNLISQLLSK